MTSVNIHKSLNFIFNKTSYKDSLKDAYSLYLSNKSVINSNNLYFDTYFKPFDEITNEDINIFKNKISKLIKNKKISYYINRAIPADKRVLLDNDSYNLVSNIVDLDIPFNVFSKHIKNVLYKNSFEQFHFALIKIINDSKHWNIDYYKNILQEININYVEDDGVLIFKTINSSVHSLFASTTWCTFHDSVFYDFYSLYKESLYLYLDFNKTYDDKDSLLCFYFNHNNKLLDIFDRYNNNISVKNIKYFRRFSTDDNINIIEDYEYNNSSMNLFDIAILSFFDGNINKTKEYILNPDFKNYQKNNYDRFYQNSYSKIASLYNQKELFSFWDFVNSIEDQNFSNQTLEFHIFSYLTPSMATQYMSKNKISFVNEEQIRLFLNMFDDNHLKINTIHPIFNLMDNFSKLSTKKEFSIILKKYVEPLNDLFVQKGIHNLFLYIEDNIQLFLNKIDKKISVIAIENLLSNIFLFYLIMNKNNDIENSKNINRIVNILNIVYKELNVYHDNDYLFYDILNSYLKEGSFFIKDIFNALIKSNIRIIDKLIIIENHYIYILFNNYLTRDSFNCIYSDIKSLNYEIYNVLKNHDAKRTIETIENIKISKKILE